jgi:hypothetical protein
VSIIYIELFMQEIYLGSFNIEYKYFLYKKQMILQFLHIKQKKGANLPFFKYTFLLYCNNKTKNSHIEIIVNKYQVL